MAGSISGDAASSAKVVEEWSVGGVYNAVNLVLLVHIVVEHGGVSPGGLGY